MSLQSGVIHCEILALIINVKLNKNLGILTNKHSTSLCFTPVFLKFPSQLHFSVRNHPLPVYIPCTPDNFSHWFPSPTALSFTFHFFTPQIHLPVPCFLFPIFTTSPSVSVLDPARPAPFTLYSPTFLLLLSSVLPVQLMNLYSQETDWKDWVSKDFQFLKKVINLLYLGFQTAGLTNTYFIIFWPGSHPVSLQFSSMFLCILHFHFTSSYSSLHFPVFSLFSTAEN